ncbi:MAG: deoxyuridine 5'-triphosphate nucleotidohydrolase [Solobacterium sp.]|nr:deoxyuridine 5'-triphosphate nucleotidohydrolase [Solobacterium sp.]
MLKVAKFEKVSFSQFCEAWKKFDPDATEEKTEKIYHAIQLPKRATTGSAGYDFFAPCDIHVPSGSEVLIPTGIRAKIVSGNVLMLFPRSSLGFKYRFQLNNTVGIIDSDYYDAKNEGHIFCKMINDSREKKNLVIEKGEAFVQGIFLAYGITEDDDTETVRTGGIGSTNKI